MQRRASDFSLSIRFRPAHRNDTTAPGFYLMAGFANEGEAEWVAEDRLLTPQQFQNIGTLIDSSAGLDLDGRLMNAMREANADAEDRRRQRIAALTRQRREAADQLRAMGAEVE